MRVYKDSTGILEAICSDMIKSYFPDLLGNVNILYCWNDTDKDSTSVWGTTYKLNNRQRDLFEYDFIIEICRDRFDVLYQKEREKLLYHELCHVGVVHDDENMGLQRDKEGRIKTCIIPHDIDLQRFRAEISKYGLSDDEDMVLNVLEDSKRPKPNKESNKESSSEVVHKKKKKKHKKEKQEKTVFKLKKRKI